MASGSKVTASIFDPTVPWTAFTPTWTGTVSNPSLGNGTLAARWQQFGKTVFYGGRLDIGSTTTFGSGTWNFSLPVPFRAASGYIGTAFLSDATGITYPAATGFFGSIFFLAASGGNVTPTSPFTWATSDNLSWTIIYEAA